MHKPGASLPCIFRQGFREYRSKFDTASFPLPGFVQHIQIRQLARSPIKVHWAFYADVQRVFDDRLDRGEAGAAGDEDDRLVRVFAQKKSTKRTPEAQDVALFHDLKHMMGECAARDVADR